nr:GNAT family N-acetyltransferase [Roseomonas sp. GC11]
MVEGIRAYNESQVGDPEIGPLSVVLRDPESGAVLGGLTGKTNKKWLFIELFHLPESLRQHRLGAKLLALAEDEARRRGCIGVWLDTYSFQAPGFYEKQGYRVFGSIPDHPPGHQRFFYLKRL